MSTKQSQFLRRNYINITMIFKFVQILGKHVNVNIEKKI